MVYVPWRLSSLEACHVSEEEWAGLRSTVIEALNSSTIGLEGPSVHGSAWDDWFEELAERVAREYWPKTDRVAVRRIFRPQVIEMAGVERGKRRAQRAGGSEDSDGGAGSSSRAKPKREEDEDEEMGNAPNASTSTPTVPRAATLPSTPHENANVAPSSSSAPNTRTEEMEDTSNVATNTLTPSEAPRRGPGRPKKPPVHSPAEQSDTPTILRKHPPQNPHEEVNPTPLKRPRISRAQPPPPWIAPRPQEPPSAPSAALGLILETRIPPSEKMKIIYASDTPTLALFLERVRKKFHLASEAKIHGVEVEISGGKTYVVDLEDGRDWLAVQEIARTAGTSAVGVVVEIQSH
ncbi:hypothetical protein C7212DRAFT_282003 [Tuber magnatum]|uniref:Uncharacterized protein n=1 Tax=Tuber magnatum TaxID=42249 RepID=A0A317SM90_9PEZI|nr:hypothetical protein C7212DRAFT_282003 [Tuber magnatum]